MQKEDMWIHSICDVCEGACGILVHRVDGVVVDIKGDPDCPNSRGKTCGKAGAAIMHLYDPNRVKTPLKRTNPEKGIGIDPGWVPISWDEALNILEEKLTAVRKDDPRKLVITTFDTSSMERIKLWIKAFGTPNLGWTGYYCGQYLHSSMFLTNGSFHCDFDADHINYLLLLGSQAGFGAGLNPNITAQKVAAARKERNLKVVVVDPICTPAASKADEWVPIRPGADAALMLAMVNVLLNREGIYDREFIKRHTNGPYLVKPDGYYIRRDGKPLVWDAAEGRAKPYDAEVTDYAIEGSYAIDGNDCRPAFALLKEHVRTYTPEMAAEITTIPAATICRLAKEFGEAAQVGSTVLVDGVELPYRPAAANIYRGAGAHRHGVACALAVQILNMIVGNFYVPGGHRGMNLIGPAWEWGPGEHDGLITPPTHPEVGHNANYYTYKVGPPENLNLKELYPISTNWSPMNLAASLDPERYKLPYKPEVLLSCRRNLFMGGCDYGVTAKALKSFKFIASFCVTLDEMSEFADLVLPEAVGLEKQQFMPNLLVWSMTAQTGYFYWGIRQPGVLPLGEARDWVDVLTDLADRMGFLGDFYDLYSERYKMKGTHKLERSSTYTKEEIGDRRFKARFGEEKGLEWFKNHGFTSEKRKVDEMYPLPWLKARFPLYFENIMDAGRKVKATAERIGIQDWDISDYQPLPDWKSCAADDQDARFDLTACNFRVASHAQSWTAQNPWLAEVAELNPYAQRILINRQTAKSRGIKDGERICVESPVGRVVGLAKVTECIHPEAVGISSHFGSLCKGKPVAYGKGASFTRLVPYRTDPVSTGVDGCVRVKVDKA